MIFRRMWPNCCAIWARARPTNGSSPCRWRSQAQSGTRFGRHRPGRYPAGRAAVPRQASLRDRHRQQRHRPFPVGLVVRGLGLLLQRARQPQRRVAGAEVVALQRAGAQYKRGFESASKGATASAEADQKKLADAVATAAKRIKASRESEADAARKVAIEEAKLAELRDSGKAKSSQLLAAEDKLTKSRRNHVQGPGHRDGDRWWW